MSTAYYFVEALDVLMLGGHRGRAGAFDARRTLPPWPSVFAGAFRSALLAGDARKLAAFSALQGERFDSEEQRCRRHLDVLGEHLFAALGTPRRPGAFRITWLSLASLRERSLQPVVPLPADLVAQADGRGTRLLARQPAALPSGVRCSASLPMVASLHTPRQAVPLPGHWLDGEGLRAHLQGRTPAALLRTEALYRCVARSTAAPGERSHATADGAPGTRDAVGLAPGMGFLVGIEGAPDLPDTGLLRLGGNGHGTRWQRVTFQRPGVPLPQAWRFRLLLTTPAVFANGWLPYGVTRDADGSHRLHGDGFSARLACAALPRHEVVSGWDLVRAAPKAAQRAVPAGAVYWFDRFEGDAGQLARWVAAGLWPHLEALGPEALQRRAEGFNNALLGSWP